MFISINNSFEIRMEGYSPVVKPEKGGGIEIKHTTGELPGQREQSRLKSRSVSPTLQAEVQPLLPQALLPHPRALSGASTSLTGSSWAYEVWK